MKWGTALLSQGRKSSSLLYTRVHTVHTHNAYNSQLSRTCYPFVPSNNILPIARVWCGSLGWHIAERVCVRVCVCVCVRYACGEQWAIRSFFRVRGLRAACFAPQSAANEFSIYSRICNTVTLNPPLHLIHSRTWGCNECNIPDDRRQRLRNRAVARAFLIFG